MLNPVSFTNALQKQGFSFFTGVPDSLLKELCACITDTLGNDSHVIAANEGAAVALASGYHLATGKAGVVYMQNSGTGNAINPLLSLADPSVYAIPMLVIIGWRAEPGVHDEPQHVKQGEIQEALLASLGYPYEILSTDETEAHEQLTRLRERMASDQSPVVLLVRKGSFTEYPVAKPGSPYVMSREQALSLILPELEPEARIVSTTGKTSREIYELRDSTGVDHSRDFLTVGSMGHAVSIATGFAKFRPELPVYCIDGDGAAIMHMGSLAVTASQRLANFKHILINNGAHESVGGQPTAGFDFSFEALAKEFGYHTVATVTTAEELPKRIAELREAQGPAFLEVRVKPGARKDLGRPRTTPQENKRAFMEGL